MLINTLNLTKIDISALFTLALASIIANMSINFFWPLPNILKKIYKKL